MEGEESLLEVFVVSVAIGASLQGTDLIIDAFEGTGRNRFVIPVEQVTIHTPAISFGAGLFVARASMAAVRKSMG